MPSGTVVYDYGILHADEARPLHCPCGRTDSAGRAEAVIAAHLAGAPAGTRAVILIRAIAGDGTTGPAYLYALAERGANGVTWPTHLGIRAPGNDAARDARDGLSTAGPCGAASGPRIDDDCEDRMTATATDVAPGRHGRASWLWRRQLGAYPDTGRRVLYLGITVLATVTLYYELYVGGSVATLLLTNLRMSFAFYVVVLAFGNLIGAFG